MAFRVSGSASTLPGVRTFPRRGTCIGRKRSYRVCAGLQAVERSRAHPRLRALKNPPNSFKLRNARGKTFTAQDNPGKSDAASIEVQADSAQPADHAVRHGAVKDAGKPVQLIEATGYDHFDMAESLGHPFGPNGRAALAMMKLSLPAA